MDRQKALQRVEALRLTLLRSEDRQAHDAVVAAWAAATGQTEDQATEELMSVKLEGEEE